MYPRTQRKMQMEKASRRPKTSAIFAMGGLMTAEGKGLAMGKLDKAKRGERLFVLESYHLLPPERRKRSIGGSGC